nr:phosphatidylinositol N-acetylglucosaminyltransferase subunit A-like [Procambarus clarkii]
MEVRHVICMVSDFFYPNVGGVEEHIFQLSQCLLRRGHKVIVLTHIYNDRRGIRYMTNGLKSVFTDHSLFGFADMSAIVTNNFLALSLADVNHCICVSYVGKENTVLRANVDPKKVSVIPNALDSHIFKPDPSKRPSDKINVIVMSRLQYRKGVDLQPAVIRHICRRYPQVNFIIGGDGPKRSILEEIRDEVGNERLKLVGAVPHAEVHGLLVQGHIFLNTSLTEAFCIAICEAVCSGLQVVSTNVGGIPEVLPSHLIHLAHPTVQSLTEKLEYAIEMELNGKRLDPWQMHEETKNIYLWSDVVQRTEIIYNKVHLEESSADLIQRIPRYKKCGLVAGWFMMFLVTLQFFILKMCDRLWPSKDIDIAVDYPVNTRRHFPEKDNERNINFSLSNVGNGIHCHRFLEEDN